MFIDNLVDSLVHQSFSSVSVRISYIMFGGKKNFVSILQFRDKVLDELYEKTYKFCQTQ